MTATGLIGMKKNQHVVVKLILLVCIGLSIGCVHVNAWERGNLAKSQMELDPHPLQSEIQSHNYSSREAAPSHKSSAGGGGCGCY
jgi:hypothetical protein